MENLFDVLRHMVDRMPHTWRTEAEKLAAQDIVTAFQDEHYPTTPPSENPPAASPTPETNPFTKGA